MLNKKDFILGIIAVLLIGSVFIYGKEFSNKFNEQVASIGQVTNNEPAANEETDTKINSVDIKTDFTIGGEDAPLEMIDFSSHFCSHCTAYHNETFPTIYEEYVRTGKMKIRFVFLSPEEISAAMICAEEQGDFMEFSNKVFESNDELIVFYEEADTSGALIDRLAEIADASDLSGKEMKECLLSGRYAKETDEWFSETIERDINGLPAFIIGEEEIIGNQPLDVFEEAIQNELDRLSQPELIP